MDVRQRGTPGWGRLGVAVVAAAVLGACGETGAVAGPEGADDPVVGVEFASAQAGAEVNAAADGTFEFLPPLVESSDPAGDFDPALSPVIEVCQVAIEDDACGDWPIAVFTRETDDPTRQIQVDETEEYYYYDWATDSPTLDPASIYRIRVVHGGLELGHVDIDPVATEEDLGEVDTSQYFGFVIGDIIPIRFHITAEAEETVPAADLSLAKEASVETAEIGDPVEFTLTVANVGPDQAVGVVVTDDLPGELAFVSATPTAGSCAEAEGVVTCDLGDLAFEGTVTITIVTDAVAPGEAENEAEVESETQDPVPEDNEAEATVEVLPAVADVSLTKTASVDEIEVGGQLDYTLTVTNAGPDIAPAVVLTDALPDEVSFVDASIDPESGSCEETDGEVSCALGDLAPEAVVTVTVTVQADEPGDAENEAEVETDAVDPDEENNEATALVTVLGDDDESEDDDAVTITDGFYFLPPIADGVPGRGPNNQDLEPVVQICEVIEDACVLPAVAEFDREDMTSISDDHFHVNFRPRDWDIDPDADYRVRVLIDGGLLGATELEIPGNGKATVPIKFWIGGTFESSPLPSADLSLTKVVSVAEVEVGDETLFTLTVTNDGPDAASAYVEDALPEALDALTVTPSQGSCEDDDGIVACAIGELASGGSATIEILVTAGEAGTFENEAWVRGTALDGDPSNNGAAVEVVVTAGAEESEEEPEDGTADLAVSASLSASALSVGDEASYVITVDNAGPASAAGAELEAELSNRFDILSVAGDGDCSIQGHKVRCDFGDIDAGDSRTVTVALEADRAGTAELEVEVESQTEDPDEANNESSMDVTIGG